jgi:hypothetical protein
MAEYAKNGGDGNHEEACRDGLLGIETNHVDEQWSGEDGTATTEQANGHADSDG